MMTTQFYSPCRLRLALFLALGTPLSGSLPASAAEFEQPPTLSATDLVPRSQLKGPHFRVADKVPTDGFLTHFTVISDFGTFAAIGPGTLPIRIREIEAIAKLQQVEQEEQLQKGATESAKGVVAGVKSFIDKPEETLQGIPDGVGRFFQRSYRNAKTGVQKFQDRRHESGSAPAGPGANLPGAATDQSGSQGSGNLYADAARALGGATADALGFDEDRRRLSRELGVDPYTTNPVLDKALNDVTWAAFAGNLGVDLATAMIPGGALLSSSQRLSDWVWDTPPGDLRLGIERRLLAMGATQDQVDRLLRHRWYSLSMQAALVAPLTDLKGVDGRVEVLPLALTVTSEAQADFVIETLRMLARYHATVKPLSRLQVAGTILAEAKDGELVVAAPVDYLSWGPELGRFSKRKELNTGRRSVYLAGQLTPRARKELQQRGWQVHADSKLFVPVIPAASASK